MKETYVFLLACFGDMIVFARVIFMHVMAAFSLIIRCYRWVSKGQIYLQTCSSNIIFTELVFPQIFLLLTSFLVVLVTFLVVILSRWPGRLLPSSVSPVISSLCSMIDESDALVFHFFPWLEARWRSSSLVDDDRSVVVEDSVRVAESIGILNFPIRSFI